MNDYVILADVTCDLSEELRTRFGVEDYLQGHIHFSDGRDFPTTLDWSHISRADFYKALSDKKLEVSTAPASPEEYYTAFKAYAEKGMDVLNISISIYCFDSYKMSGAMGLLVLYAHQLKAEGKTLAEVADWLEQNKHRVHQMGPIDDLIFVARRGRLTMGKAIMGSFAGVKPMGDCNRDGYVSVLAKVKGINKALDLTVRYVKQAAVDLSEQIVFISHSNREEYALHLQERIQAELQPKQVLVSDVFSGCGTNIGPGMVAVYFLGEEISEDLAAEKALMNELLNG